MTSYSMSMVLVEWWLVFGPGIVQHSWMFFAGIFTGALIIGISALVAFSNKIGGYNEQLH